MSSARRSFSTSEKIAIINEANQYGVNQTLRKHNLSHSVFSRLKQSFIVGGATNLHSYAKQRNPELDAAMEEIRLLNKMLLNSLLNWSSRLNF